MARRKKDTLQIRNPQITIIGEGLTEHYYFKHLKALKGYRYMCKPRYFTKQNLGDLEKLIQEVLESEGIVVCVFDADVSRMHTSDKQLLAKIKQKYKNVNNVLICDSMPSIEFWFLVHYINTNRYFSSSNEVINNLRKFITDFDKTEEYLEKEKWVAELIADGKQEMAITRSKLFGEEGESYSNLYKAFEMFETFK